MGFTFTAKKAIHDSGSKFYQVIRMSEELSGRSIVVTHWGKHVEGSFCVPGSFGLNKLEAFPRNGTAAFNDAIRKKQKRGYTSWHEVCDDGFFNRTDFEIRIRTWFKSQDGSIIIDFFKDTTWITIDELDTISPDIPVGLHSPFELPPEPPKVRSMEWGTW